MKYTVARSLVLPLVQAYPSLQSLWERQIEKTVIYEANSYRNQTKNVLGNYCKVFIGSVVEGKIRIPNSSGPDMYGVCVAFGKLRHACFGMDRQTG